MNHEQESCLEEKYTQFVIDGRELRISYPNIGNASRHVEAIVAGKVYPKPRLIEFTPTKIIDIGASNGIASGYFLSLYPRAEVFCFEPNHENFQLLEKNLNHLSKVTLYNYGLWEKDSEKELYAGAIQWLQHSLFRSAEVTEDSKTVVLKDARAELRDLVDENSLLKIDTEGCEVPILKRIIPLLDSLKVVYLEVHSEQDRIDIDRLLTPTHSLWSSSSFYAHRADLCYVHRTLYEHDEGIQRWIVDYRSG